MSGRQRARKRQEIASAERERLLDQLRASPVYGATIETIRFDLDEWRSNAGSGYEDYPGEAEQRVQALELLLVLLGETA